MNTGPFIHSGATTRSLMLRVLLALSPIVIAAIWRHGYSAASLYVLALLGALLADVVCKRGRSADGSTLVTAVIFACLLPSSAPGWLAFGGGAFAILFGKHLFGGRGQAPFNPAAMTRVVLMGLLPAEFLAPRWRIGGVTSATPLAKEIDSVMPTLMELALGSHPGALAQSLPLAVFAGGLLLVALRTIDWRVPLCYLATLSLLAMVLPPGSRMLGHAPWLAGSPLSHLLAGGVPLAAFFMLPDPVTSPFTARGRVLYAVLAGIYTLCIRFYTPYPDGAVFAILLANASTPLLDRLLVFPSSARSTGACCPK